MYASAQMVPGGRVHNRDLPARSELET